MLVRVLSGDPLWARKRTQSCTSCVWDPHCGCVVVYINKNHDHLKKKEIISPCVTDRPTDRRLPFPSKGLFGFTFSIKCFFSKCKHRSSISQIQVVHINTYMILSTWYLHVYYCVVLSLSCLVLSCVPGNVELVSLIKKLWVNYSINNWLITFLEQI